MERKKLILIVALIAIVLVGVIGGTIAYFNNKTEFENKFIADQLSMEVTEDFTSPTNWLPGETVEKRVRATNTTKLQMAVRISYTERWEDKEGNILDDYYDGKKAAIINFVNEEDWLPETKEDVTYYYYYRLLNPEETTSDFMKSVTFNENVIGDVVCVSREDGRGEECKSSTDYEDATYYLNIKIEMIAYEKYKENWDTDIKIAEKEEFLWKKIRTDVNDELYGATTYSGTEEDQYPVYYYTSSSNRYVAFNGFCWQVLRTTETGGVKLLYQGVQNNSETCSTSYSSIGSTPYNISANSIAYTGYMYNTVFPMYFTGVSQNVYYSTAFTYSGGKYVLTNPANANRFPPTNSYYKGVYTCLSTTSYSCSTVYFIWYQLNSSVGAYQLTGGSSIQDAMYLMLQSEDTTTYVNKHDSSIKTYIDNWYENNMINVTNYLEDTVFCNNREVVFGSAYGGYLPVGISNWTSLSCENKIDMFTVSKENGNGDLTYPIALSTSYELILAAFTSSNSFTFWNFGAFNHYPSTNPGATFCTFFRSCANNATLTASRNVVPSISLMHTIKYTKGDGTASNPYVISAQPKTD